MNKQSPVAKKLEIHVEFSQKTNQSKKNRLISFIYLFIYLLIYLFIYLFIVDKFIKK